MKFEAILTIIKSTDSDYLKAARLFDAMNPPIATTATPYPPVAAIKARRKRGPNKPKGQPPANVGHSNGMTETAGE